MNLVTDWERNRTAINSGLLSDADFHDVGCRQKELAIAACSNETAPSDMLQIADGILCDNASGYGADDLLEIASQLVHMARMRIRSSV